MRTATHHSIRLAFFFALISAAALRAETPPTAAATRAIDSAATTAAPRVADAPAAAASQPDQVVDDDAIDHTITTQGAELMAAKKTVAIERLIRQLEKAAGRRVSIALPAAANPAPAAMSPAQIYTRCQPSILVIGGLYKPKDSEEWQSSVATGFAINDRGAVVTCHHVVKSDDQVTLVAMTRDGKVLPVTRVIAASAADDLAIVEVPGLAVPPLPLATDPPIGSEVCVVSHPDGRYYSLARGYVTRYSVLNGEHGKTTLLETSAEFAGGSSGGPVLNDRGGVVGIVCSTLDAYSDAPAPDKPDPQHNAHDKAPATPPKTADPAKPGDGDAKNKDAPADETPQGPELQMVFKECVPVSKLLALIEREKPTAVEKPAVVEKPAAPAGKN